MTLGRCVKFSLSPIFAISRTLNDDVKWGLFFVMSIFGNFREVVNSAKIKPTRKIPAIRYVSQATREFHRMLPLCLNFHWPYLITIVCHVKFVLLLSQIQRLYGKYLRADSYRKALIYQKKYLLLLLGGFQDCEETTLALIARMGAYPSPEDMQRKTKYSRAFTLFRSAARVVVAVTR